MKDNSDLSWNYITSEIEGSASKYFSKDLLKTNKGGNAATNAPAIGKFQFTASPPAN